MAELRLTRRAREDLRPLTPEIQAAVLETLTLIGIEPESAGKQLVGRLAGLWSARIGSYRVLYTIEQSGVVVRAIRHHAVVYRRPQ